MGHKHAENMKLYAEDAAETEKPWERWERRYVGVNTWGGCTHSPEWDVTFMYRRKAKTILINGFEVPEPVREKLEYGQTYFVPYAGSSDLYTNYDWCNDPVDRKYLEAGFVHLTKEAAIEHAEALISFTRIDYEN